MHRHTAPRLLGLACVPLPATKAVKPLTQHHLWRVGGLGGTSGIDLAHELRKLLDGEVDRGRRRLRCRFGRLLCRSRQVLKR
jgi:hypothetical protein